MVGTITNDGLEYIAKLIGGVSTAPFKYIAVGTGTDAESQTSTALQSEISSGGCSRAEGTATYQADNTIVVEKAFSVTGTLGVNEIGLFDTSSGGKMLIRGKLASQKNVNNGDTLTVAGTIIVYRKT